jgi:IS6 family transposase
MLGFNSFETAKKAICGIELMHIIKKGHVEKIQYIFSEIEFLNKIMDNSA